jgi:carbon monoxide dehydrogenase subunit G
VAHYRTSIRTPLPSAEAFEYMADLRNFEEWDPGVQRVTQITGDGAGPGATFDVVVDAPGGGMTLRYETTDFDDARRVVVEARSRMFTSIDQIDVTDDGGSTVVTYDAALELNGVLKVFDVILRPVFARIGGRAEGGLLRVLEGQPV